MHPAIAHRRELIEAERIAELIADCQTGRRHTRGLLRELLALASKRTVRALLADAA